ncbi:MAG TPA: hypothetical protein VKQ52_00990 [Puia sp.]|nr:hypothetical protein [Puia sp.]
MNSQKQFINCCYLLLLLTLSTHPATAQDGPDQDSRLYNGYEYIRNGTHAQGFPFFGIDSLQPGTLVYDGILHRDIAMEYDLVLDKLVIPDYTGKALISLISEKVDRFTIGPHAFRYFPAQPTTSSLPKQGFYEELLGRDSVALLARREKKLVFPSSQDEQAKYEQSNSHFLLIGNRSARVADESSLLDMLKDKKDMLKKYIRDNHIRFKKDLENALIATTSYYLKLRN